MRNILELAVIVVLFSPFALLPLTLSGKAGELLGLFFYYVLPWRRRIALENLRTVMKREGISITGSPEAVIRERFRNAGRMLSEMVKVYFGLGGGILERIEVEGLEHYEAARARGRGVIFVTGHCGNWELWGLSIPTRIGRAWGVARRMKNPCLNAIIEKTRQRYGGEVVYQEGALKKFISVLREGGTVGIVMDEYVRPYNGVCVDFLGAPTWVTKMTVSLARKTSAAVIPVFMHRTEGGHLIRIHSEVELEGDDTADTGKVMAYIEDYIRENPSEWLLWLRRWKRKGKRRRPPGHGPERNKT
jgi:KDO2-lipid IV(A) lauroyltransferase